MNTLHRLRITLQKKTRALDDDTLMLRACNADSLQRQSVFVKPFRHIVIENIFTQEYCDSLCAEFNKKFDEGKFTPLKDSAREIVPNDVPPDGLFYMIRHNVGAPTNLLFTNAWNCYFAKLFNVPTGTETLTAFHFHPTGDHSSVVHHDSALRAFDAKNILPNGVITVPGTEINGNNYYPERDSPTYFLSRRAIALIIYLNNDSASDVGGGTGLYESRNATVPVKIIEPTNNRLLTFDIHHSSYHSFLSNKTPRSSIVQWFYVDNDWFQKKYANQITS